VFDEVVVVDFSASSVPVTGANSIWVGHGATAAARVATANPPTRRAALAHVDRLLGAAAARGSTVLVAVDFSLGYPAGFTACTQALVAHLPGEPAWLRTWRLIDHLVDDGPDNANNRFAAADRMNRSTGVRLFWGRPATPAYAVLDALPPTDVVPAPLRPNPCAPLRVAERLAGRGIRSNFQLFGGVTVGGQVLVGIPWLLRLLERFRPEVAVWPFETGFVDDPLAGRGTRVVVAELWPSLFVPHGGRSPGGSGRSGSGRPGAVRDEVQVVAGVEACLARDRTGWARWFDPASAAALGGAERASVLTEEGWILGVA